MHYREYLRKSRMLTPQTILQRRQGKQAAQSTRSISRWLFWTFHVLQMKIKAIRINAFYFSNFNHSKHYLSEVIKRKYKQ